MIQVKHDLSFTLMFLELDKLWEEVEKRKIKFNLEVAERVCKVFKINHSFGPAKPTTIKEFFDCVIEKDQSSFLVFYISETVDPTNPPNG